MNKYIQELKDHLQICEERDGFSGIPSMLDFLWQCYACQNPVDDGFIKEKDAMMQKVLDELSFQSTDDLFSIITDFIGAYQRAAFLEGIAIGAKLDKELFADCN